MECLDRTAGGFSIIWFVEIDAFFFARQSTLAGSGGLLVSGAAFFSSSLGRLACWASVRVKASL